MRIDDAWHSVSEGIAGTDTLALVAKLEKMTGCGLAQLASYAQDWPD